MLFGIILIFAIWLFLHLCLFFSLKKCCFYLTTPFLIFVNFEFSCNLLKPSYIELSFQWFPKHAGTRDASSSAASPCPACSEAANRSISAQVVWYGPAASIATLRRKVIPSMVPSTMRVSIARPVRGPFSRAIPNHFPIVWNGNSRHFDKQAFDTWLMADRRRETT